MRIGLMHGGSAAFGGGLHTLVQEIVDDENDGFDCAWFGQVFEADVMTVIALAGARTTRIEMGTGVVPTYTRHPWAMAQQAMTVQAASGGRFTLGIGPSHQIVVESMWGLSYDKPARHVREYLAVLLPLVREGRVQHAGELYRTMGALNIAGGTRLPVLISALAPVMLRMAGEQTDGTITWMTGPKTLESHVAPRIAEAASAAGRPAPRIVAGLPVCVTDDAAGAREFAGKALQMYGTLPNYRRVLDKEGAAGPADVVIAGNEAEVERQIRDVASAGATDLMAPIIPFGANPAESATRTRALLKSLVGKI